ncbi:hypothetical protein HMPREF1557_02149 [Streptococcus sobrinus W1703]|uniref:Uncharacterized protein n=1 Tax=Streptococcus sobrinus W1703 TaxID=1227275 RepID=U2KFZ9_9STRE|nr:hypothetical protein HMPREF1557_02149 [Streptococcus sobrinus W1703]
MVDWTSLSLDKQVIGPTVWETVGENQVNCRGWECLVQWTVSARSLGTRELGKIDFLEIMIFVPLPLAVTQMTLLVLAPTLPN